MIFFFHVPFLLFSEILSVLHRREAFLNSYLVNSNILVSFSKVLEERKKKKIEVTFTFLDGEKKEGGGGKKKFSFAFLIAMERSYPSQNSHRECREQGKRNENKDK